MVFNMKENKTVNRFSLNSLFVSVVSLDGKLGMKWGFVIHNAVLPTVQTFKYESYN